MSTDPEEHAADAEVRRLVGVYHASGTPWGEISYWLKARFGGAHCSLCDITHGSVREKSEWRECRSRLPVEMVTVHLDEQDDDLRALTAGRTPCVVAETTSGPVMLVEDAALRACDGSPECLVEAIESGAVALGLEFA